MVVKWSALAEERLKNIFCFYLETAGRKTAAKIVAKIKTSGDSLNVMPLKAQVESYLTGRKFVYRSLVVNKIFKVVYFIDEKAKCVVIATIWDCRRDPVALRKDAGTHR